MESKMKLASNRNYSLYLYKRTVLLTGLVVCGICLSAFAEKNEIKRSTIVRKNILQARLSGLNLVDDTTKRFYLKLAPIKVIVPPVNVVVPPVKVNFAMAPLNVSVPPVNVKFAMVPLKVVVPPVNVKFAMAPLKVVVPPVYVKFKMTPLHINRDSVNVH